MKTGKVIQIIGAAVDIAFEQGHLPAIENAIEIEMDNGKKIVAEVAQQMGDGRNRSVRIVGKYRRAPTRCQSRRYGRAAFRSRRGRLFGPIDERFRYAARPQRRN